MRLCREKRKKRMMNTVDHHTVIVQRSPPASNREAQGSGVGNSAGHGQRLVIGRPPQQTGKHNGIGDSSGLGVGLGQGRAGVGFVTHTHAHAHTQTQNTRQHTYALVKQLLVGPSLARLLACPLATLGRRTRVDGCEVSSLRIVILVVRLGCGQPERRRGGGSRRGAARGRQGRGNDSALSLLLVPLRAPRRRPRGRRGHCRRPTRRWRR